MKRAFVLMTAMPPTIGHLHLIQFAASLPVTRVTVLVCSQPGEPFYTERFLAVEDAVRNMHSRWVRHADIDVAHLHRELPQDPQTPGFWEMWRQIMGTRGEEHSFLRFPAQPGDFMVTSEPYGAKLAELTHTTFMPYDPDRQLYYTKATRIRENPGKYFADILPEFQPHLRLKVTFFGAESTGKTTLSHELSVDMNAHWLFEWARPYLETVGPDININSMTDIWNGQYATQNHAELWHNKPFIFQDTDLFSTVGYWEQPHWAKELGAVPEGLVNDALATKSDLYILLRSNIPFEEDPIRYGGDKRESSDEYWENIAKKYGLNYVAVETSDFTLRKEKVKKIILAAWEEKAKSIWFDRMGL